MIQEKADNMFNKLSQIVECETSKILKSAPNFAKQSNNVSTNTPVCCPQSSKKPSCGKCHVNFGGNVKKHHCKACNQKYCGECSKINFVSSLMLDSSNSDNSKSNLFRLCSECSDILSVADEIFYLVKQKKQQMFKMQKETINENDGKENCYSQMPPSIQKPLRKGSRLKLTPMKFNQPFNDVTNNYHRDNLVNANIDVENDNDYAKSYYDKSNDPKISWYHLSPTEKERMRRKIYVPPAADDKNAFYFVGNQRIVRRTAQSIQ